MKSISATYNESDKIYIMSYGTEDNSKNAHWGRGYRNVTILHYVLNGTGYYNGKKVESGEGFFIPAGVMHEYHSSEENPWSYFWVELNGEESYDICQKYINADQNGIFKYDFKEDLNYFTKKFFSEEKTISAVKAIGIFLLLMSYHEKSEKIYGNKYVTESKKYMEQNLHRKITVCEIAQTLYISDRYLYNLFVECEGMSPKQYLSNLRLQRACSMLRIGKYTITEVAISVGFNDVLTFSRFFKNHMKMSPTEYKSGRMI